MKKNSIKFFVIALAFTLAVGFTLAKERSDNDPPDSPIPSVTQAVGAVKSCQVRELAIKNRMKHLTDLVTKMFNVFDKKTTKVENYYTNTLVPAGKTLSNYNSLVADIQTKKTAAQTALSTAQSGVAGFNCTGDIRSQMTQFRKDMQAVKRALKDYRKSIVNLIRAVRSLTGEAEKTPTPTP